MNRRNRRRIARVGVEREEGEHGQEEQEEECKSGSRKGRGRAWTGEARLPEQEQKVRDKSKGTRSERQRGEQVQEE